MKKSEGFQAVVESIVNLKQTFEKIGRKLPPYLIGMYGELRVALELGKQFPNLKLEYKSGQSKSDIDIIRKGEEPIHVEVKTSRYKQEWYGEGYGFALNVKKCTKHPEAYFPHERRGRLEGDLCYFDFLVCVCLSNDLKPKYYVFSQEVLNQNSEHIKNKSSRFSHSPYRIIVPTKPKLERLELFDKMIYEQPKRFVNRWDKIT